MTCLEKMYDYNQTRPSQMEKRAELIKEMFAEAGEGCYIEPPFYANWGGRHVHLGNHVYPMRRKTPCFSYGDIRRIHRIYASN